MVFSLLDRKKFFIGYTSHEVCTQVPKYLILRFMVHLQISPGIHKAKSRSNSLQSCIVYWKFLKFRNLQFLFNLFEIRKCFQVSNLDEKHFASAKTLLHGIFEQKYPLFNFLLNINLNFSNWWSDRLESYASNIPKWIYLYHFL